jgi:hypothetical protein
VTLQVQDSAPLDVERYYAGLFGALDDFRGVILAPFVLDHAAMDDKGGYQPVSWDPFETANRIVAATRECVGRKLAKKG